MQVRAQKRVAYKNIALTVRAPKAHNTWPGVEAHAVRTYPVKPTRTFYNPNILAARDIERTSARLLAMSAICAADCNNSWGVDIEEGKKAAKKAVKRCREWARKNHQSFNKYFGKALANIA